MNENELNSKTALGFAKDFEEIETALGGYPGVQDAVMIVREDHPREKRMVVYYVGTEAPEALQWYLQAKLPEYKMPVAVMQLAALPLRPNGKVDRKALPAPEREGAEGAHEAQHTSTHESRNASESYENLANSLSFGVEHK